VRLTRREVLVGAATSGLGAVGLYELVDRLTSSPSTRSHGRLHAEQHLLDGLAVMRDNGVAVIVPPLHHAVVTARVVADNLKAAQRDLEEILVELERRYAPTPAGLGVTVAWGLPYFRRYVPRKADVHVPVDLRASRTKRHTVYALADAIRFPSDPPKTILEANDVAVLLRSDVREHVEDAERTLFHGSSILHASSIRRGFVGSDFRSGPSLAKRMAQAAGGALVAFTHMALWSALLHGALISFVFGAVSYLCLHVLPRPRAALHRERGYVDAAVPFGRPAPLLPGHGQETRGY